MQNYDLNKIVIYVIPKSRAFLKRNVEMKLSCGNYFDFNFKLNTSFPPLTK